MGRSNDRPTALHVPASSANRGGCHVNAARGGADSNRMMNREQQPPLDEARAHDLVARMDHRLRAVRVPARRDPQAFDAIGLVHNLDTDERMVLEAWFDMVTSIERLTERAQLLTAK